MFKIDLPDPLHEGHTSCLRWIHWIQAKMSNFGANLPAQSVEPMGRTQIFR